MQAAIFAIFFGLLFPSLVYSETIEQAWEVALGANHSICSAHRIIESAEERHGASISQRLPRLAVHGGYLAKNDPSDLESKVALEVQQVWLKLHESRERTVVTEQAVAQADKNLKVSKHLFKAGMVTHTEVLDAERLRTTTSSNHNNAVYDTAMAGLRLRRTLGEL